jgi:hypothetical protein
MLGLFVRNKIPYFQGSLKSFPWMLKQNAGTRNCLNRMKEADQPCFSGNFSDRSALRVICTMPELCTLRVGGSIKGFSKYSGFYEDRAELWGVVLRKLKTETFIYIDEKLDDDDDDDYYYY